jgi:photosystem II stability/assembly factor-like uncharacterized protein
MKKNLALVFSLIFIAASCNPLNPLGGNKASSPKGVFKSEDGGSSFKASNVIGEKQSIDGISANVLVFDPNNSETIYLGSPSGIFKSEDSAATWKQILSGIGVFDLAVDQFQKGVVYASGLAGTNGKIIKSKDGGENWEDIYTEPSKANGVLTVAVSKSTSNVVLAGLSTGEIIRSTDQGQTWQAVKDQQDQIVKVRFYDGSTVYAMSLTKGMLKSIDQGQNWSLVLEKKFETAPKKYISFGKFLDFALDFRQPGVILSATDKGLMRSADAGANWDLINLPVKDTTLTVNSVAINPNDSKLICAAIGSTFFISPNNGLSWEPKKLSTQQQVKRILINPQTPNIIYLGIGDIAAR